MIFKISTLFSPVLTEMSADKKEVIKVKYPSKYKLTVSNRSVGIASFPTVLTEMSVGKKEVQS